MLGFSTKQSVRAANQALRRSRRNVLTRLSGKEIQKGSSGAHADLLLKAAVPNQHTTESAYGRGTHPVLEKCLKHKLAPHDPIRVTSHGDGIDTVEATTSLDDAAGGKQKKVPFTLPKTTVAQIKVVPGNPEANALKMIEIIKAAHVRGDQLVVFSEMVIPGYMLGDDWDDVAFIKDCLYWNDQVVRATAGLTGMKVIFGSVHADFTAKNEDGRVRKFNAAFVAEDGKLLSNGLDIDQVGTVKTLMPKYRTFQDERHFTSKLKVAAERNIPIENMIEPIEMEFDGKLVKVGIILCEDMWSDDYHLSPTQILINKGAEVIINLSCSPWSRGKNAKRHRVVEGLMKDKGVTFIYCNNIGTQSNGKNEIPFDGGSAIFNPDVTLGWAARPYTEETATSEVRTGVAASQLITQTTPKQEMDEILDSLIYATREFYHSKGVSKAVIGLSGGADSAFNAYILAKALGPENVYAVNMPSKFNSGTTKDLALQIAKNLGIHYTVVPIQKSVDHTLEQLHQVRFQSMSHGAQVITVDFVNKKVTAKSAVRSIIEGYFERSDLGEGPFGAMWHSLAEYLGQPSSLAGTLLQVTGLVAENVQARDRGGRVLAAVAASIPGGAIFTNNGNKTETGFGYATLYGDVNGGLSINGDLYKTEIFTLLERINEREGSELLPAELYNGALPPSAELSPEQNVDAGKGDPIIYPYHDFILRGWVEYRLNPEDMLQMYIDGTLEDRLGIKPGLVNQIFKTPEAFIKDLEYYYKCYKTTGLFKRIQAPPIIIVSRRAFGFDLHESQKPLAYTKRYKELRARILAEKIGYERRIAA